MTSPIDALAALCDGNARDPKPLRLKLASGLSIDAPGARLLAEVFALPLFTQDRDLYRFGAAILGRPSGSSEAPTPLHQQELAEELRAALLALPERSSPQARRPYRDLRLFASEAESATVDTYLRAVVAAVRAPVHREPKERAARGPAKTPTEIKAAQRERKRAAEAASARAWLEVFLADDEDPPTPGARVIASELYAMAAEAIEIYVDMDEELPDGAPYRVPGPRQFYAVADEVLGERLRSHGQRFYTIPALATDEEDPMNESLADAVFDRVVEKIAANVEAEILDRLRSGDRLGALRLQRDRSAATGTDGVVVNLASRRSR